MYVVAAALSGGCDILMSSLYFILVCANLAQLEVFSMKRFYVRGLVLIFGLICFDLGRMNVIDSNLPSAHADKDASPVPAPPMPDPVPADPGVPVTPLEGSSAASVAPPVDYYALPPERCLRYVRDFVGVEQKETVRGWVRIVDFQRTEKNSHLRLRLGAPLFRQASRQIPGLPVSYENGFWYADTSACPETWEFPLGTSAAVGPWGDDVEVRLESNRSYYDSSK